MHDIKASYDQVGQKFNWRAWCSDGWWLIVSSSQECPEAALQESHEGSLFGSYNSHVQSPRSLLLASHLMKFRWFLDRISVLWFLQFSHAILKVVFFVLCLLWEKEHIPTILLLLLLLPLSLFCTFWHFIPDWPWSLITFAIWDETMTELNSICCTWCWLFLYTKHLFISCYCWFVLIHLWPAPV